MYTLTYFIIFTVRQYLDKHFKLNGLGRAHDTVCAETLVVVVDLSFFFLFLLTICFAVSYFLLGTSASLSRQQDAVASAICPCIAICSSSNFFMHFSLLTKF